LKKIKEYDGNPSNNELTSILRGYVGQCGETS
jgi:tetratricopeptide (TPR) repeat protein